MHQFIYLLSIKNEFRNKEKWTNQQDVIVSEHFNYLSKLKEEKVVIIAGKTRYDIDNDENFGVVIFQTESTEKAEIIMQNDPAVQQNLMNAILHPFNVAIINGSYEVA